MRACTTAHARTCYVVAKYKLLVFCHTLLTVMVTMVVIVLLEHNGE